MITKEKLLKEKERALEVLDEMQRLLEPKLKIFVEDNPSEASEYLYEMPEE